MMMKEKPDTSKVEGRVTPKNSARVELCPRCHVPMDEVDQPTLAKLRETRKGKEVERAFLCEKCKTYHLVGASHRLKSSSVTVWCRGREGDSECPNHTTLVVGTDEFTRVGLFLDDGWKALNDRGGSLAWICPSCMSKGKPAIGHLGTVVELRLT